MFDASSLRNTLEATGHVTYQQQQNMVKRPRDSEFVVGSATFLGSETEDAAVAVMMDVMMDQDPSTALEETATLAPVTRLASRHREQQPRRL